MYQNNRFESAEKSSGSDYAFPPQHQNRQPGFEYVMKPIPTSECGKHHKKLENKAALITGGDSGIGRAVAYDFVREGASVAIVYYDEEIDAGETAEKIKELGGDCLLLCGDLKDPNFAKYCVDRTMEHFGKLDILVNNHAMQFIHRSILDIPHEEIEFIFRNNVFSFFYLIQYALPYMKKGGSIINTTRSLSQSLAESGIRVNAVAPGPIWTPLIPASYSAMEVATFGKKTSHVPMDRAGQPCEVSPCYVFLASDDASYMTGQVLHPNGGTIVGS